MNTNTAHAHAHAHSGPGASLTALALRATLHCLTGCGIGEVLGLVIGAALGWGMWESMALAVALAFVFGYAFSLWPLLRAGLPLRRAVRRAFAADTVSIITMELADNAMLLAIPGAMHAGLGDPLFWGSLAVALAVGFTVTFPVNRWLISRGAGHALVHAQH